MADTTDAEFKRMQERVKYFRGQRRERAIFDAVRATEREKRRELLEIFRDELRELLARPAPAKEVAK